MSLKACPFCGMDGEDMAWYFEYGVLEFIEHPNTDCPLSDEKFFCADTWNDRPIEDRLRAEIEKWKSWGEHVKNYMGKTEFDKMQTETS